MIRSTIALTYNLIKQTIAEFSRDNCIRMSAALAYYTAFSLAPLLVVIVTLCGLVWDPSDVRGLLEAEIKGVLGTDGASQVKTMLANAERSDSNTFTKTISFVLLLVGSTGLVAQLQGAINDAWQIQPAPEEGGILYFLSKRLLSFGMICGIAFLLLVSLVLSTVLSAAGQAIASALPSLSETALHMMNVGITFVFLTLVFAAMFKFLPDAAVRWSDVAVGAVLTAALFVAGKYALGAYLGSRNMESTYGAAGSFALIMVWSYYSAMIFLFGAEFTQVWAKQRGEGVIPADFAVRVERKAVPKEAGSLASAAAVAHQNRRN